MKREGGVRVRVVVLVLVVVVGCVVRCQDTTFEHQGEGGKQRKEEKKKKGHKIEMSLFKRVVRKGESLS